MSIRGPSAHLDAVTATPTGRARPIDQILTVIDSTLAAHEKSIADVDRILEGTAYAAVRHESLAAFTAARAARRTERTERKSA